VCTQRPRSHRLGLLAGLIPPVLLLLGGWTHRWSAEDAFIDYRVVENILAGHGPVFNAGERVEAITNPLWAWLVAATAWMADVLGAASPPIEWSAALLGLVLSTLGLWLTVLASDGLWRREGDTGLLLPLGALCYAVLPPAWDFVTSGLETSLFVAWLGASVFLGGHPVRGGSAAIPRVLAFLCIGLGPLIRPDLSLIALPLFLALILRAEWTSPGSRPGSRLARTLGWSAACWAIPIAYQVFRMGYYASLVPNTGLAKEAGRSSWLHGIHYLLDLVASYQLWLPVAILALLAAGPVAALIRARKPAALQPLALLLGGCAHGLFIIRAGGDFMHARLLLPATFTLLAAVASLPVRHQRYGCHGSVVLAAWALLSAAVLRPAYHADRAGEDWRECTSHAGLTDERCFFLRTSKAAHPITHRDYKEHIWTQDGYSLRNIAQGWSGLLPTKQPAYDQVVFGKKLPSTDLASWVPRPTAALRSNIGLAGFAAGSRVHVIDARGLADPVAARLVLDASIRPDEVQPYQDLPLPELVEGILLALPGGPGLHEILRRSWTARARPGHEKELPSTWVLARYARPDAAEDDPAVRAARRSLGCGQLRELHEAITHPLTPDRFLDNIALAFPLTGLRIPAAPEDAVAAFCTAED
jgi:arabinofuranosyltransferase